MNGQDTWTDYDLCMLEHLSYMNDDGKLKEITNEYKYLENCKSVGDYLEQFDIEKIRGLGSETTNGDCISGEEYAAIIQYMSENENIKNLSVQKEVLENKHQDSCPLAYDLVDQSGQHIVIFKGTTRSFEWKDDVEGINVSDTQSQKDALDYLENKVCADNIIVVGHSKGGNKAMYCAIVSDKVSRCVSMDGQGFSEEFIQKYQYKIAQRAKNITNISYCSDFIHVLMNQIPGSEQLYTGKGYGSNEAKSCFECHSPNSLFSYDRNSGKLKVTGNFDFGKETESLKIISGLVDYIMYSDCDNKEKLISYIAYLAEQLGGDSNAFIQKIRNGEEKIDSEKLTDIAAYLIKYCNENNIGAVEVYRLLLDIHLIDGTTRWFGFEPISLLKLVFDYVNSNKEDQDYILAEICVIIAYFDNREGFLGNKVKNQEKDKYLDLAMKVLLRIKSNYNNIHYDDSEKTVIFPSRLKKINPLSDMISKSVSKMYYNLQGIQNALSKLEKAENIYLSAPNTLNTTLSGKALDACTELYGKYNDLQSKIFRLIEETKIKTEAVYNAVVELENKQ